ncbi:hypothetical protein FGO68_gene15212 [Halteria grandinella]|uniref:Dystroglycan-type cadherin-like domain-containing protein n=1 Tax=Halteria grandinella TaxID=5974 RepID=A0A8J8P781_HALGN|nr:hypothetical protein FGO68_gene15212 [Halteria grandinella]
MSKLYIAIIIVTISMHLGAKADLVSTCKNYPIVIGGYEDYAYLNYFDVSSTQSELVAVGNSFDCYLMSPCVSSAGYVILYENLDSSPPSIKWAKYSSTSSTKAVGAAFRSDDQQIIVQFNVGSSIGGVLGDIMAIFAADTGAIVWRFQISYSLSFSQLVRGLALTSDSVAYVFGQMCSSSYLCAYRIFRKEQSMAVTWARKSVSNSAKALGMSLQESIIGRVAVIITYESLNFMLQMLDAVSSTPDVLDAAQYYAGSSSPNSYSLFTLTDKVFCAFTNSTSNLYIFTATITTIEMKFDIFEGKQLLLAQQSSLRELYASGDDISILTQVSSGQIYFMTLNFNSNAEQKQQIPMNQYYNQILGKFLSSTVYLVGGHQYNYFNTGYSTQTLFSSKIKGLIMSNDALTSCYSVDDEILHTYDFQQSISLSSVVHNTATVTVTFYESSVPISFLNINTLRLVYIDSWCNSQQESIQVDQSISTYYSVIEGENTVIDLNPFSYCGAQTSLTISYQYGCLNCYNSSSSANYFPQGLTITGNSDISVLLESTPSLAPGEYDLQISLTTLGETTSYTFTYQVYALPIFLSDLQPVTLQIDMHLDYYYPVVYDDSGYEVEKSFSITDIQSAESTNCPSLSDAEFSDVFTFYDDYLCITGPSMLSPDWACVYTIEIVLTNEIGISSNPYTLDVTLIIGNQPPQWLYGAPEPVDVQLGEYLVLDYSEMFIDPNDDELVMSIVSSPYDAQIQDDFSIIIYHTLLYPSYLIHFQLSEFDTTEAFVLDTYQEINIVNYAPYFEEELTDQRQTAGMMNIYYLPKIIDDESPYSDPIELLATINGVVPSFITYSLDGNFLIFEGQKNDIGDHVIDIKLTDSLGNSSLHYFKLKIQEQQVESQKSLPGQILQNKGPPSFTPALETQITIEEGKSLVYPLPSVEDPDNDDYLLSVQLQAAIQFVTYADKTLKIKPLQSHVSSKPYVIVFILSDDNKNGKKWVKYSLEIIVLAKQSGAYVIKEGEPASSDSVKGNSQQQGSAKIIQERIVKFRISAVSNEGIAKIKVIAQNPVSLINQITNLTFSISLISREIPERVNYTIESKASSYLNLKLIFQNPFDISNTQEQDKIMITTKIEIASKSTALIERIPQYYSESATVPIQLSEAQAGTVMLIQKSGDAANYAVVSTNLILNLSLQVQQMIFSSCLEYFFNTILQLWNIGLSIWSVK